MCAPPRQPIILTPTGVRSGFYVANSSYEPEHATLLTPDAGRQPEYLWSYVGSVSTQAAVRGPLTRLSDERSMVVDAATWNQLGWRRSDSEESGRSAAMRMYADSLHVAKFIVCHEVSCSVVRIQTGIRTDINDASCDARSSAKFREHERVARACEHAENRGPVLETIQR